MDDQHSADAHPLRRSLEVLDGRDLGVAAIDEQQLQRTAPRLSRNGRLAHNRDDMVVQPGGVECAAKSRQRVK